MTGLVSSLGIFRHRKPDASTGSVKGRCLLPARTDIPLIKDLATPVAAGGWVCGYAQRRMACFVKRIIHCRQIDHHNYISRPIKRPR